MRKRLVKKILGFGPNQHYSQVRHMVEWQMRLHPPFYDEARECWVHPSCHAVPIIARAWVKAHRLIRKYGSVYKNRKFNHPTK